MQTVYCIGETVLDIAFKGLTPIFSTPGGSALNTSVTLGRLESKVQFISQLGQDIIGQFIIDFLKSNNVSTDFTFIDTKSKTSLALAFLDNNKNAEYSFYKYGINPKIFYKETKFQENDIVLFSSSFAINKNIRDGLIKTLEKCVTNNCILYYDPNIRFSKKDLDFEEKKQLVLENIHYANIVRGSDEDFKHLFDTTNPDKIWDILQQEKCRFFIYTQSNKGVILFFNNEKLFFESKKITPISTIGAGDSFNAGILFGLQKYSITLKNLHKTEISILSQIIRFAIEIASSVCMSEENYISENSKNKLLSRF